MAQSKTNLFSLQVAVESSIGVLPGSPTWFLLEPNDIGTFGATIKTVARSPISKLRQRRKGTIVDLDSAVEFEHDTTKEVVILFSEGFVFATYTTQVALASGTNSLATDSDVAGAGTNGFVHTALSGALADRALVYARGFLTNTAVHNGMHMVDGANSTTTVTAVTTASFIDEVPSLGAHATLERAGHRGASGDLTWTQSTKTLGSTALNLTTLGLVVGQLIHLGGLTATNQFNGGVLYGRVRSIAAGAIVLDKITGTLVADDTGAGKQIDILFGRFLRNVAVDHASYLTRSYQFEGYYDNLQNPDLTGPMYEYSLGNLADTMEIKMPLTDKSTISFGFVGTDTQVPTTVRKTGASTPVLPVQTAPFGTTSDIARLRLTQLDEDGLTTCFKDLTFKMNNGVTPEKCLGTLGATYMNVANFLVDLDMEVLFTNAEVVNAIRNNETVTMDFLLRNADGAIAVDVPAMTLGDGKKSFPINETIKIKLTGEAFIDPTLGTSVGISLFPAVP